MCFHHLLFSSCICQFAQAFHNLLQNQHCRCCPAWKCLFVHLIYCRPLGVGENQFWFIVCSAVASLAWKAPKADKVCQHYWFSCSNRRRLSRETKIVVAAIAPTNVCLVSCSGRSGLCVKMQFVWSVALCSVKQENNHHFFFVWLFRLEWHPAFHDLQQGIRNHCVVSSCQLLLICSNSGMRFTYQWNVCEVLFGHCFHLCGQRQVLVSNQNNKVSESDPPTCRQWPTLHCLVANTHQFVSWILSSVWSFLVRHWSDSGAVVVGVVMIQVWLMSSLFVVLNSL